MASQAQAKLSLWRGEMDYGDTSVNSHWDYGRVTVIHDLNQDIASGYKKLRGGC